MKALFVGKTSKARKVFLGASVLGRIFSAGLLS
jgi:hypothetical protein